MRLVFVALIAAAMAAPATASASHSGPGGERHDFAVGSAFNQFLVVLGEARLSFAAHSGPAGEDPTGHVRAKGDPFGLGDPFKIEGHVTCLRVEGNRAAIKYLFRHAEGSAEPFKGGGTQVFVEDNGEPRGGVSPDRSTFDPPQTAEGFEQLDPSRCDDPRSRLTYDQEVSGNVVVHDSDGA